MPQKSRLSKGIFSLLFICFFSIKFFGQTPQAGLSSNPADANDILQLCEGTAVSFTGFQGGLFDAPKSYEFFIVRNGVNLVGQARSDRNIWEDASIGNELLDDDQVFVRAYDRTTAEGGGTSSDSRRIQIISIEPPAPTLISDTPGNTFCNGQEVVFRAFPNTGQEQYAFYINDLLMQGPGPANQFTSSELIDMDIVRVDVSIQDCVGTSTLQMVENRINDPGQIRFDVAQDPYQPTLLCLGQLPPLLLSDRPGMIGDQVLPDDSQQYQWSTSIDGIHWEAIDGANGESFQPNALTTSTFFRRTVISTLNTNSCFAASNVLEVQVVDLLGGGQVSPIDQTICEEETPLLIEVNSMPEAPFLTYQWQSSIDGINFTDIETASTAVSYQAENVTQTTHYRRVTFLSEELCSAISEVHTLNVLQFDAGILDPNRSASICFGEAPPFIFTDEPLVPSNPGLPASSNGVLAYQWEKSTDFGASWLEIPNATFQNYTAGPLEETTWFRRKVYSVLNEVSCEQLTQNQIEIVVAPAVNAGWIDASQTVC